MEDDEGAGESGHRGVDGQIGAMHARPEKPCATIAAMIATPWRASLSALNGVVAPGGVAAMARPVRDEGPHEPCAGRGHRWSQGTGSLGDTRAMAASTWDLTALANAADPRADAPAQHLWLARLLEWLRHAPKRVVPERNGPRDGTDAGAAAGDGAREGSGGSTTPWPVRRLRHLVNQMAQHAAMGERMQGVLAASLRRIDLAALFADFGFAERPTLGGELLARLQSRWLPTTPDTSDGATLFALWWRPEDAEWLRAIDDDTLHRLAALLPAVDVRDALLDAVTTLGSHLHSAGHGAGLRRRMDAALQRDNPFRALPREIDDLREALEAGPADEDRPAPRPPAARRRADTLQAANRLRARLQACRAAADSVTAHLEAHGVSVAIVHAQELVRLRCDRIELLLDVLLGDGRAHEWRRLILALLDTLQQRRGIRPLLAQHYALLARHVADRNAETGEHYITRDRAEYRAMLGRAAGGGIVIAGATLVKFAIAAIGLSAFWTGFWSGVNYALCFVVVMLLHWTVATKQPAMTAPALAASLPRGAAASDADIEAFVDRVAQLIRSQAAGIFGNVGSCVPAVLAIALALQWFAPAVLGVAPVAPAKADAVLDGVSLLGPTVLFAAFTGVLLFVSSLIAGWVENWFVLHRLDSAIALNPRSVALLGAARARRVGGWWRRNVSGVAANVSLGMMLGLVPALLGFVGLPLDVRHVTLASGQVAAAAATLGVGVLALPALWWAAGGVAVTGLLNVAVSFWLAFRVALRSRGVRLNERARINAAIRRRMRQRPGQFLFPPRAGAG
jgi:site-specific recombinase